jgi:predicted TIM-barrel enzyme
MKLALILKKIADKDATQFITNMGGLRFKGLGNEALLLSYTESEEVILQKLQNGLSADSNVLLFALAGTLHGAGSAIGAEQQLQAVFAN